jgi:PAS domain S-box-containing protein
MRRIELVELRGANLKHPLAEFPYIPRLQSDLDTRPSGSIKLSRSVIAIFVAVLTCVFSVATSRAADPQDGQATARRSLKTIIVENYQPYTFMNERKSPDGFSVDIIKAVAKVMDFDLGIHPGTWEQATKELERGTIDLLPMMAYSVERDKKFDFSVPHTIAYDAIFYRSGDKSPGSLKDLSGKTVIVMNKDAAHDYLLSSGLSETMRLHLVDSLPEALRQLSSGKGDAAIMPKLVGILTLKKLNLSNIDSSPPVIDRYTRPFSFAVREGDQALLERLNQGLVIIKTTGQYDAIYNKWFGAIEGPNIPWKSALQLIFLAGIILVVFAAWNVSLKHQVKSRTKDLEAEVAERKLKEDALRESEEQLATILRTATDGFWVTGHKGQFLEVNDAICRNLGYSRDELLRMSVSDIEVTEKQEEILQRVRRIMERGSDQFEGLHRRKDGSLRNVEVSVNYLPPPHDRFFAFLRDITEHKKLETEYFQAQKMEAVGTLAGGIAHDFNNALTGIVGFGELLRMRMAGDEKALHDLDEIQRCAERASTLTRQLLTFARRQVIEPVNLNLNTLVADLMKLIGKVVGEHIEVKTSLEKDVPTIHADRGQIEQVVMNLCLNSRDAMPEGGRLVVETGDVSLEEEYVRQNPYMKTGRYALLTVSDTGIGMDEKTRARAFEPFFTTKGPNRGTGLGLSMVYGIVKQHGGFIHLYSEPGKGTAFKVYFPAIEAQPDAVPERRREESVRGGMETILLAEDEEGIRSFIERALKEFGYTVLVARNGEEAIEIFRQHKEIVLAVLDVVMPRKGGREAFEEMHKQNPRLKVIFMSGYNADAVHDSFVLIPGTPFLQKPFGPTILARKVREVLDTQ